MMKFDNTNELKIGLIGLGSMGQNYLRILQNFKGINLAFVFDINFELSSKISKRLHIPTDKNLENLLPSVDAAVICTPTTTHGSTLRIAAKYVKFLLIEKPLSYNLNTTLNDVKFIEKHKINVQIGFIERFNPVVKKFITILEENENVLSLDFNRTNKLSSRVKDIDVISDLMVHDIDLALYINGPVESISSYGNKIDGKIGLAYTQMRHLNGRLSRLQASKVTEKKIRKISATCSDIFVECELVNKELWIHRNSEIVTHKNGQSSIAYWSQKFEVEQQEALFNQIGAFLNYYKTGRKHGPDQIDALDASKVCEAIKKEILAFS